jgi:hypothetical protein
MFSLPLRATAHIPELEVEKNKSTKKSFKPRQTPIAVYPTLRSMLVLMDVFRAEEKKKGDGPKTARRKSHSENMPPSAC